MERMELLWKARSLILTTVEKGTVLPEEFFVEIMRNFSNENAVTYLAKHFLINILNDLESK